MIAPDSPSLPERIARHYQEEIRAGRLQPGDTIPPTWLLVQQWHVGTGTARQARRLLCDTGWARRRLGWSWVLVVRELPGTNGSVDSSG